MKQKEKKIFRINFGINPEIKKDLDLLKNIYNQTRYTDMIKKMVEFEKIKHNIK